MWVTERLDRARRRLRPTPLVAPDEAPPAPVADVERSLVRADLERLIESLSASLDPSMTRPDSPALLARALTNAIDRIGGCGRPSVRRSPAGLYTPEYWHIRIEGADARTRDALERLSAGGRVG